MRGNFGLVYGLGYRYKLHRGDLPGKPDLVFSGRKKAIFVNGCFWHRHPDPECKLARMPKSRLDFWRPKLEGNAIRDKKNPAALSSLGWSVLVVWECQLRDPASLKRTLRDFLEAHRAIS
ncbi:MAG: DNA mismatch endonuclease Vsr [Gammaproteobacteria bacterium]|nr:DNA mismatch endonuclease Vsr [Gammaproteobacteria bacterium]